ncbi:MAG: hypothetical protein V1821_01855, partial [bacterium]
ETARKYDALIASGFEVRPIGEAGKTVVAPEMPDAERVITSRDDVKVILHYMRGLTVEQKSAMVDQAILQIQRRNRLVPTFTAFEFLMSGLVLLPPPAVEMLTRDVQDLRTEELARIARRQVRSGHARVKEDKLSVPPTPVVEAKVPEMPPVDDGNGTNDIPGVEAAQTQPEGSA